MVRMQAGPVQGSERVLDFPKDGNEPEENESRVLLNSVSDRVQQTECPGDLEKER